MTPPSSEIEEGRVQLDLEIGTPEGSGSFIPSPLRWYSMNIISWNCRGVSSRFTNAYAREILKTKDVGALCLLETKTNDASCFLKMAERHGFHSSFIVSPLGFAGGLLLVWNKERLNLSGRGAQFVDDSLHGEWVWGCHGSCSIRVRLAEQKCQRYLLE